MVTVSFTLGVSIDSFDAAAQQTFKVNLAAQLDGVSSSVILLTVEAGSLVVAVQIPTSTAEDADTLVTTLSSDQPMTALSAALGYTIEATSIPAVKVVELAAPSPPLPVPPLSPVTIESSDPLDFDSATYCSAEYLDHHETWTIEHDSPPTSEQQELVRRKVMEYSYLHCVADVQIEWNGVIGTLKLFGDHTRDVLAHHERLRQAHHRSELLLEHLHRTHGVLEDGSLRAHLVAFHWHRPFYHPWVISFFAPQTYPFELFTCWLAAPMTAVVAVGVVLVMQTEPHFAGLVDIIATLPVALLRVSCYRMRSPKRRRMLSVAKAGTAAFIEGLHFWHTVLFVYEVWRSHHPDFETVWRTISLLLLVMPVIVIMLIIFAFSVLTMNSASARHIDPATVRRHPRCVALISLFAALHIELLTLLPWRSTSWAGYPSQGILLSVILLLLLQKLSMLILSVHFIQVEPNAFGMYVLILSAVSLTQVLMEKILLLVARRAEDKTSSSQVPTYSTQRMEGATTTRTPSTLLPENIDEVLLTTRVRRLHPMLRPAQQWILHSPGVLRAAGADTQMRITKGRLYLEQGAAAGVADSNGILEQWPLATLARIKRRRHEMRHTALEITMAAQKDGQPGGSVLLDFNSRDDRERVVQTLLKELPHLVLPDECLQEMTEKWHAGKIDNYTYLLHLNECASRSFSDLSQYPIMCALACFPLTLCANALSADAHLSLSLTGPGY